MTYLSLTINKSHKLYDEKKEIVLHALLAVSLLMIEYVEIVKHKGKDTGEHYHILLISKNKMLYQDLEKQKSDFGKLFHFEITGNVLKYQIYMNSHDVVDKIIWGDMPYIDSDHGDKLALDVANGWSVKQLLLRHGMKALRQMRNIQIYRELDDIDFSK